MRAPDTKQPASANLFGNLSFLVIDDFESFRISMRHMLHSCGASNIESVAHAGAAIRYCTYNQVDVVLCDHNLGEGKNGQHVLEELRHKKLLKRSSLFLMVTSETSREMVMSAREHQPDAYLTKPINQALLENRLGRLITQRNALLPINREIDRENYPAAISLCTSALAQLPRYKTWLLKTLAELYFFLGDLSHALKVYDDVLSQRELSWARLGHSKVLLANHRYDEAVESLRLLIKRHPDYVEAYDQLAEGLERQGRREQAQKVLQQATEFSPNGVLRQKQLAVMAESNQDMETAAEAWRKAISLGTYSIHNTPDHYLALSHVLVDISEGETDNETKEPLEEALNVLADMEKQFPDRDTLPLRSKIIQCRIHADQGYHEQAETVLTEVQESMDRIDMSDLDARLDYARTLFRLGRAHEAVKLLRQMAEHFEQDPEAVQKIQGLLDEPVSYRTKIRARGLNREGIAAFESADLKHAESIFDKALGMIPNHPALNLNQVQVLMKQYESNTEDGSLLTRCGQHLNRLAGLPEQHGQYKRYLALTRKLKALNP